MCLCMAVIYLNVQFIAAMGGPHTTTSFVFERSVVQCLALNSARPKQATLYDQTSHFNLCQSMYKKKATKKSLKTLLLS